MAINKITAREIAENAVEGNLPDRPSQDSLYAERGMTAGEVKAAYDKLPKLIAERFNELVTALRTQGEGALTEDIPTGIAEGHTLRQLFLDVLSGAFADYVTVDGQTTLKELVNALPQPLFSVTDADNGRYLRVVNGAWAAVAGEEAPLNAPIITLSGTTVYASADSASWGVAFYKDGVLLVENEEGYVDLSEYEWEDGVYTISAKCIGTDRPNSPFSNTVVYVVDNIVEQSPLNAPIITLSGTTVYASADSASWGVAFYKDGVLLVENEEGYVDLSEYEWEDGVYTIAAKCIGTNRPDSPFGNTLVYVVGNVGGAGSGGGAIDLASIPEVDGIDDPTESSPSAVKYNGEIYLLVKE